MKKFNLFLDFDNTFIPSKLCYNYAVENIAYDLKGLLWDTTDEFNKLWSEAREESQKYIPNHPAKRNRLLHFKWLLKNKLSPTKQIRILMYLETQYFTYFFESLQKYIHDHKEFYKEVFSLLEAIQEDTFLCFVTNETLRTQVQKYQQIPFPESLPIHLWSSEEAGSEKPHKDYFSSLARHFGVELHSNTCIIGDSIEDDVQAGLNHKWITFLMKNMNDDRNTLNTISQSDQNYFEVSNLITGLEHYIRIR
jgi:HAD superfamily hydrolase (TIGR01549 family)